jgi:hypothetical protein
MKNEQQEEKLEVKNRMEKQKRLIKCYPNEHPAGC